MSIIILFWHYVHRKNHNAKFLNCKVCKKINGEIEDTKQASTVDCWLLTNLNWLRNTNWGKELVKNSIQPDGNGGVFIIFKGAKTRVKKFHVSA